MLEFRRVRLAYTHDGAIPNYLTRQHAGNGPPVQLIPSHAAINIPTRESRQSPSSPPDGRRQVVVGEISPRRRRTTAAEGEGR